MSQTGLRLDPAYGRGYPDYEGDGGSRAVCACGAECCGQQMNEFIQCLLPDELSAVASATGLQLESSGASVEVFSCRDCGREFHGGDYATVAAAGDACRQHERDAHDLDDDVNGDGD